jgi:thymidylate synthase
MEQEYLSILRNLVKNGERRETRSGVVYSSFGHTLSCDLSQHFPLLTTKKMYFKGIVEELAWFLRGSTDVTELRSKKVHIWDGNTEDRSYDAGPVYGFQWRHFGAPYTTCKANYAGKGKDQIVRIMELIKDDPTSRRIFLSAWNPQQQHEMALPPCHVSYQFYVDSDDRLSVQMYQRSADAFLGLPFNIASTALLCHLLANETGKKVGRLRIVIGDLHLYEEHAGVAVIQTERIPHEFPQLQLDRDPDGLWTVKAEEIKLVGYKHHPSLKAKMAV